jgi:O-acetyl-ADP-ribose deacetylase (regulator of RNase III)
MAAEPGVILGTASFGPAITSRGWTMQRDLANRIRLVVGDITKLEVDAVVTAANEALCGGSGVDGAIHRAAGPALFEECRTIGICPQGEARITKGYLLPAKFIIHTVGPVYEGGEWGEAKVLASCYRESLKVAEAHDVRAIAFPCIATGAYEYPRDGACQVAVDTAVDWPWAHELPHQVIFCCYEDEDALLYRGRLGESGEPGESGIPLRA